MQLLCRWKNSSISGEYGKLHSFNYRDWFVLAAPPSLITSMCRVGSCRRQQMGRHCDTMSASVASPCDRITRNQAKVAGLREIEFGHAKCITAWTSFKSTDSTLERIVNMPTLADLRSRLHVTKPVTESNETIHDESLIADARSNLSPAQMVELKLRSALLGATLSRAGLVTSAGKRRGSK